MTTNHPAIDRPAVSEANGSAPLVHAQETSTQFQPLSSYRTFLISGMLPSIEHHRAVYEQIDIRNDKKNVIQFTGCKSFAWFVKHRTSGQVRVASSRCNLRWCPLCIKTKRFIMLQSLVPWVKNAKKPKFITLTLKHSDAPLRDQITRLYDSFKVLRRSVFWSKRVTGGVWFFQIKKSETDGLWHPHLHILADGRYLPHEVISPLWLKITGDSSVIDLRGIKDVKKTSEYVARYATAPANLMDLDIESAVEVVESLAGRRVCGTFGTAKGVQLVPKKCPDASEWEFMCSFTVCVHRQKMDDWHEEIFTAWKDNRPTCADPPGQELRDLEQWPVVVEEPKTFKQLKIEWSDFF